MNFPISENTTTRVPSIHLQSNFFRIHYRGVMGSAKRILDMTYVLLITISGTEFTFPPSHRSIAGICAFPL